MNVIADTGAIRRGIVCAEDGSRFGSAQCDLQHARDEMRFGLMRLAAPVGYEISDPLDVPAVFDLIAELGDVGANEMYEVFNMGCGFVCVVAAADAEEAVELLRRHHPGAKRIGTVTQRDGVVI